MSKSRGRRSSSRALGVAALALALLPATVPVSAYAADDPDPRIGLAPGYIPWSEAARNIELLDNNPREGDFGDAVNSDLAFTGDYAIAGSYNGFQVFDISDPADPALTASFLCPGGQGDVSVHGDLLFMSVEETRGRIDCGTQGAPGAVNPERFRGVRIFDISDISAPEQVAAVQTCRGSHTHTLVTDPSDPDNLYVYNSGTAGVRAPEELPGCEDVSPNTTDPVTTGNPAQWRIDVIKVPLAAPEAAEIVSQPRIFTDATTGAYNGLQNTLPGELHPSGNAYGPVPNTNTCHDITAYPELGLAAGACQGNGILLDISDPVNPVRLDAVADPNFSYWHSATLNNDGTKVIFTDEWGGGGGPRCRDTDQPEWGADAIFDIVDGKMQFASYYKMPAPQTTEENCVAHNGSLIPVPGRDILVQAWYQGGLSVVDFTDSANPKEIAFYDRGPISGTSLSLGGYWSTYWYNGNVFGNEIARGFDAFELLPSDFLSAAEIAAASAATVGELNAQAQTKVTWAPSFDVTGSYLSQAVRSGALSGALATAVTQHLDQARALAAEPAKSAFHLDAAARRLGSTGDQGELRTAIAGLRGTITCAGGCTLPTSVAASPASSSYGTGVRVAVTVTGYGSGLDAPGGTVVVTDAKGKELGKATPTAGAATITLPSNLPVGAQTLTATYSGDANNARSSTTFRARVKAGATTTKASVKPGKPRFRKDFRVVVRVKAPAAEAKGKVVVTIDGKRIAAKRLSDGRLELKVRKDLSVGTHKLVATYQGSRVLAASKARATFRVVRR